MQTKLGLCLTATRGNVCILKLQKSKNKIISKSVCCGLSCIGPGRNLRDINVPCHVEITRINHCPMHSSAHDNRAHSCALMGVTNIEFGMFHVTLPNASQHAREKVRYDVTQHCSLIFIRNPRDVRVQSHMEITRNQCPTPPHATIERTSGVLMGMINIEFSMLHVVLANAIQHGTEKVRYNV